MVVDGPDGRLMSVGAGSVRRGGSAVRARAPRPGARPAGGVAHSPPARRGAVQRDRPTGRCCSPHRATLLPLAPTVLRRQRVSTTHDPAGGRRARGFTSRPADSAGARLKVFYLRARDLRRGPRGRRSAAAWGGSRIQAMIRRDARDEYVIEPEPDGLPIRVHGSRILRPTQLRTGARIEMGPWTMVYFRAEYADHGRPYGGRQGGEIDQQQWQPAGPLPPGDPWGVRGQRRLKPELTVGRPPGSADGLDLPGVDGYRLRCPDRARSIRHQETKPITQNTP